MVSKGQFMGLDWRVVGSNPIWGSDFFRVLQTFNLSCVCCFIFNILVFVPDLFVIYLFIYIPGLFNILQTSVQKTRLCQILSFRS